VSEPDWAARTAEVERAMERAKARHSADLDQAYDRGVAEALREVLPPFDDMALLLTSSGSCANLTEGLRLIGKKAAAIRAAAGLK
jgi:molecular chaperone GrpE (heat shock protein)